MTHWLAGMKITAARLNNNTAAASTSTGTVDSANFATSTFQAYIVNGVTWIEAFVNYTGGGIAELATNTGNITDTPVTTLPSGYRPPVTVNCVFGNGSIDGEATISSAGLITIRSISGNANIVTGTNLRFTSMWISGTAN